MNHFTRGFGDELVKLSGALSSIGRFAIKHPMLALGVPFVVGGTALAAKRGYSKGRKGGEGARYLEAGYDPISRRATTSRAAYTNYNPLFDRSKPTSKQLKRISGKYKEKAFKR